jgi:RNA-directed DNA polymerase
MVSRLGLASGSYFPPPKRGRWVYERSQNRIAQTVVTRFLQPLLEPHFHVNSYGYRLEKLAKDALAVARQRCWRYDWVLERRARGCFSTSRDG